MSKSLRVSFPEKCVGCELCVLMAQKLSNFSIGISNSPIKVIKEGERYILEVDEGRVRGADKIVDICPAAVFTLED